LPHIAITIKIFISLFSSLFIFIIIYYGKFLFMQKK
jgi:hypothetical protein